MLVYTLTTFGIFFVPVVASVALFFAIDLKDVALLPRPLPDDGGAREDDFQPREPLDFDGMLAFASRSGVRRRARGIPRPFRVCFAV